MRGALGPYVLEGELGRGGMGSVYRARHGPTGAVRAVKLLDRVSDLVALDRFRREIETLARVGGEGVVAIHESGVDGGRPFFAMELMAGGSLRARLAASGRLPWSEAAALVASLARTLERCHALGVIHRDVKPENILFDERGKPCLADFGCVRDLTVSPLTETGTVLGTTAYMPPEQFAGKPIDASVDTYALGVVLYELVTGVLPYRGTEFRAARDALDGRREPASTLGGCPPALDDVIGRALEPDAARRYASTGALADAIDAVLAGSAPGRRSRAPLLVLGALLVAGGAVKLGSPAAPPGPPEAPAIPVSREPPTLRQALEPLRLTGGVIPVASLASLDIEHRSPAEIEDFAAIALDQGLDGDARALAESLLARSPGSRRLEVLRNLEVLKRRRPGEPPALDTLALHEGDRREPRWLASVRLAFKRVEEFASELDAFHRGERRPHLEALAVSAHGALEPLARGDPRIFDAAVAPLSTAVWTACRETRVRRRFGEADRASDLLIQVLKDMPAKSSLSIRAAIDLLERPFGMAMPQGLAETVRPLQEEARELAASEPLHAAALLAAAANLELWWFDRIDVRVAPEPTEVRAEILADSQLAGELAGGVRSRGTTGDRDSAWADLIVHDALERAFDTEVAATHFLPEGPERVPGLRRALGYRERMLEDDRSWEADRARINVDAREVVRVHFTLIFVSAEEARDEAVREHVAAIRAVVGDTPEDLRDLVEAAALGCEGKHAAARELALGVLEGASPTRILDDALRAGMRKNALAVLVQVERQAGKPAAALGYMRQLVAARPSSAEIYVNGRCPPTPDEVEALEREAAGR
jgi:hypothetical protein